MLARAQLGPSRICADVKPPQPSHEVPLAPVPQTGHLPTTYEWCNVRPQSTHWCRVISRTGMVPLSTSSPSIPAMALW